MADLTQYLTAKYNKMIGEISTDLGKVSDDLANTQNIIKALRCAYKSQSLTARKTPRN